MKRNSKIETTVTPTAPIKVKRTRKPKVATPIVQQIETVKLTPADYAAKMIADAKPAPQKIKPLEMIAAAISLVMLIVLVAMIAPAVISAAVAAAATIKIIAATAGIVYPTWLIVTALL